MTTQLWNIDSIFFRMGCTPPLPDKSISLEREDLKGLTAKTCTQDMQRTPNQNRLQWWLRQRRLLLEYSCRMLIAKSHMHLISDIHRLDIIWPSWCRSLSITFLMCIHRFTSECVTINPYEKYTSEEQNGWNIVIMEVWFRWFSFLNWMIYIGSSR